MRQDDPLSTLAHIRSMATSIVPETKPPMPEYRISKLEVRGRGNGSDICLDIVPS